MPKPKKTEQQVSPGLRLQEAHPDDAFVIGNQLRAADTEEINLVAPFDGCTTSEALADSIECSDECFAILDNHHRLLGFWGHGSWLLSGPESNEGFIWLVSTDELFARFPKELTRLARDTFFPQLDRMYSSYGNMVLHNNTVHIKWLASLGFKLHGSHKIRGETFYNLMRG